ncbi:hypothetical protein KJ765_00720 [Candidatus Micrarchaeota archaeon]|nr:hypothetical protein [Candidatus Micrarchaeota archaeon]
MTTKYVCTGSCHGEATEEEYNQGAKTCGTEGCEKHGEPLEKRMVCDECQGEVREGEAHACG